MNALPPILADQLTQDLLRQQTTIQQLQRQLHQFGYHLVDTPLIEYADLFLIKAGDAAISRLVSFDLPGRPLCLRPEFTAPAARLFIEHFQDQPGALRLQFAGPILQYESLHHSQIRQQNAVGAELLNENSPTADAEIIALAGRVLADAGLPDWQLTIGHSGLIERFLDRYDLDRQMRRFVLEWLPSLATDVDSLDRALEALAELSQQVIESAPAPLEVSSETEAALHAMVQASPQRGPTGGRTSEEIARRLLDKQRHADRHQQTRLALHDLREVLRHARTPADLLAFTDSEDMHALAQELIDTFALLEAYGVPAERVSFNLGFTRNLDYYTGIVFEYRTLAAQGSLFLGGGGRYDELVRLLGAPHDVPAVGFTVYVDHVLEALHPAQTQSLRRVHVLAQARTRADAPALVRAALALRASGVVVTTALSLPAADIPSGEGPIHTHTLTLESDGGLCLADCRTGEVRKVAAQAANQLLDLLENDRDE